MASNATWIKNYLPGSFRGVPFFIRSHTFTSGRRNAEHQFPGDNRVEIEDLGRGRRRYSLSAYLIGDDYFPDRDRFIAALEQGGPGRLVHPYLGVLTVNLDGEFSSSETTREGRMVRFEIKFVSGSDETLVQVERNTTADLSSGAAEMKDANSEDFAEKYTTDISGITFVDDAIQASEKVGVYINNIRRVVSPLAVFTELLNAYKNNIVSLINTPLALSYSITTLLSLGTEITSKEYPPAPEEAKEQILEMSQIIEAMGFEKTNILPAYVNIPQYTPRLIYDMTSIAALTAASELVGVTPLKTVEDGQALGDLLFPLFDLVLEDPLTGEELTVTVREMRRAVYEDLLRRIAGLATIADVVLAETSTSLNIVYGVNGSLDEEEDFVDRNQVRHPGFVHAPSTVRVVLDA